MKNRVVTLQSMLAFLTVSFLMMILQSAVQPDDYTRYQRKIEKQLRKHFSGDISTETLSIEGNSDFIPTGTMFSIIEDGQIVGYYSVRRAKGCRIGGCSLNKDAHLDNSANYEHFDYFTIFAPDTRIVYVAVLEYHPEQGYEICNRSWLNQFAGRFGKDLNYDTNVDALSGATTSAYSITYDLSVQSRALLKVISTNGIK